MTSGSASGSLAASTAGALSRTGSSTSIILPTSIFAGLVEWYNPGLGRTGDPIQTLVGQQSAISIAQGTADNRPDYGATAGENSTPAATFDGSNDSLVSSGTPFSFGAGDDYTVIAIAKATSVASALAVAVYLEGFAFYLPDASGLHRLWGYSRTGGWESHSFGAADTNTHMFAVQVNASGCTFHKDSSSAAGTGTDGTAASSQDLLVGVNVGGVSEFWPGVISDVLVVQNMTADELASFKSNYVNPTYGLGLS